MTAAEARATIQRLAAATHPPLLPDADWDEILADARRPDSDGWLPDDLAAWEAGASYPLGTLIAPSARNDHFYILVDDGGGSLSVAQPAWPTTTGTTVREPGGTFVWQEAGRAYWHPTYDTNAGAADAWERKMGACASSYNISDSGQSLSRSQMFDHCQAMSNQYRRKITGTITVSARANYGVGTIPNSPQPVPVLPP